MDDRARTVRGFRKIAPSACGLALTAMMTWLTACGDEAPTGAPSPAPSFTLTAAPTTGPTPSSTRAATAITSPTPSPTQAATPIISSTASSTLTATTSPTLSPTVTATLNTTPTATPAAQPVAPLSGSGRWLIDATGRVVMFHGMNMVEKRDPYYPAAYGFGDDDAAFLAAQGFNALRLGVDFRGLMPTPGVVEDAYIENLATTVDALTRHQIFVLIDFHQDGFSPMFNGNGFPDWMAITDGLPNPPDAVFPTYYVKNPAMQRAFEHFWANSPGPNGIGLEDYFMQGLERVVARFADNPLVLGTEVINEPFPGKAFQPCLINPSGCPDLEQQRLVPLYQKAAAASRRLAPQQLVFGEPFVLFNFGQAATSLPGKDSGLALAVHSYATSPAAEVGVVVNAVKAAQRDQAPLLLTEFGAVTDPVVLNRLTAEMEHGLVPWLFWAYEGEVIGDLGQPAGLDNLRSPEAFAALVRPYPVAITGTPTMITFDPSTNLFDFTYDTVGPGGSGYSGELVTVVFVPALHYPDGYTVTVDGATVVSAPCAPQLLLRNDAEASTVSVHVAPGACQPAAATAVVAGF